MLDDYIDLATDVRQHLRASLPAAGASDIEDNPTVRMIEDLTTAIDNLTTRRNSQLVAFYVEIPATSMRGSITDDGISFSQFTYTVTDEALLRTGPLTANDLGQKDPNQFVFWGNATRANVRTAFEEHTRLPAGPYRWKNDQEWRGLPGSPCAGGILIPDYTHQYVAMQNTATPDADDWVWSKSTGLQPDETNRCWGQARNHIRFFSSDNSRVEDEDGNAVNLGPDGHYTNWTVLTAHYETATHSIQPNGWQLAEDRVIASVTTPIPNLLLPWVESIASGVDFGNKFGPDGLSPQGIAHDGRGHLIKMGAFPTTTAPPTARPREIELNVLGNHVTISKPEGATWFDYEYRRSSASSWTLGHDNIGSSVTITGLDESTSYQLRVRAVNARSISGWWEPNRGTINTERRVPCQKGTAVADPDDHPALVADCHLLLGLEDTLEASLALNWGGSLALDSWDGITVGGTPQRVTKVELPGPRPGQQGRTLQGTLPAAIAQLTGLQVLSLGDNALSGEIPAELAELELTHLYLGGNNWDEMGCIPVALRDVPNNDLHAAGILYCLPAVSIGLITRSLQEGEDAVFFLSRTGATTEELTVHVSTSDGEADYLKGEPDGTVTFAVGITTTRYRVATDDDHVEEDDGVITVTITAHDDYNIRGAGLAPARVTDNDSPAEVCARGTVVSDPDDNPGLVADCTALLAAKDSLIGTGENVRTLNWGADVAITQWDGIPEGSVTGTPKRVTKLYLPKRVGNKLVLTGVIPEQLGSLAKLKLLVLQGNKLTGAIPVELGELGNLATLNLHSNLLEGAIPAELGKLQNLQQLYLRSNSLSGAIPTELGNLDNLRLLDLRSNSLSGAIPTELGNLGNLQYLWLNDNSLSGRIPDELEDLGLNTLMLAGNAFTDCVPPDLRSIRRNDLASLELPDCDTIPPTISGTPVAMVGDDPNDKIAAKGETITVTFLTSEPVTQPAVKIAGQAATVSEVQSLVAKTSWKAVYTPSEAGLSIANASFDVGVLTDAAGNTTNPDALPTGIAIDTIAPTATVGKAETSGNEGYAKEHDTITVPFATSADLAAPPTATIGGKMAKVDPDDNEGTEAKEWKATYTVVGDVNVANADFVLDALTDAAGNVTDPVTVHTNIAIDTIAPAISGDPEYGVTGDDGVAELNELITVKFVISEEVSKPTATIGGQMATVVPTTVGSKTNWTAKYTVNRTLVVDDARFDITGLTDLAGNTADPSPLNTGIEIDSPLVHTLTTYVSPSAGGRVTVAEEGAVTGRLDISEPTIHSYADGTQVRAKPITNDGYRFNEWTAGVCGTDTNPRAGANDCLITMDANKSITAFFVSQCKLVVENASGGKGLGSTTVDCGTTVTATADPDDDHRFGSWTGVEVCESQDDTCDLTVGTAGGPPVTLTLTPSFVEQCMVSVGDPDNGTITATGRGVTGTHDSPWEGDCNTVVTIKAAADSGYCWSAWDDAAIGETDTCEEEKTRTITITADTAPKVYSATFEEAPKPQCELDVTYDTPGGTAGTDWRGDCDLAVDLPLTADLAANYRFDGWTITTGTPVIADASLKDTTVTLEADAEVHANFQAECTVRAVDAANGTVTVSVTVDGVTTTGSAYTGDCGFVATWMATAHDGYCFEGWTEHFSGLSSTCLTSKTRTETTSSADQLVVYTASFYVKQCTLKVNAATGGEVAATDEDDNDVDLPWTGPCGDVITITATPDNATDYRFGGWTGGGCGTAAECDVTVGTAAGTPTTVTVTPSFPAQCHLVAAASAGGTVDPTSMTVDCGEDLSSTATANTGYCFNEWVVGVGRSSRDASGQSSCLASKTQTWTTTVGTPVTLSRLATFYVKQCTLKVPAVTGGEVAATDEDDNDVDLPWTGPCGDVITIDATADTGYRFGGWTGGGCGTDAECDVTVGTAAGAPTTVTATPSFLAQCSLVVSAGLGGSVTGGGTIDCGGTLKATATADDGYCATGWTPLFNDASGLASCRSTWPLSISTTVGQPATYIYSASFEKEQCTLTVKAGTGGTASGTWTGDCGTTRTVTATPDTGYRFGGWSGSVADASAASTTVEVDESLTVTANFIQQCTLTVNAGTGGTASGTWTGDCGTTRSISADADDGYRFGSWSGSVADASAASTTVEVDESLTVTANFIQQCTLTVKAGTGGEATGSWTGDCGTTRSISADADDGYRFSGWTGDLTSTSASTTILVDSDKTVSANFIQQCTLVVRAGTGGTVTGGGTADCGQVITARATADDGYCWDGWHEIFSSGFSEAGEGEGEGDSATTLEEDEGVQAQHSCRTTSTGRLTTRADKPVRVFEGRFYAHEHRLTITTSSVNGGAGTVTPAPGTHTYETGTEVTISAEGIFRATHQWGGACSGFAATCTVTMDGNKSVSVTFHGSGFRSEEDEEEDASTE